MTLIIFIVISSLENYNVYGDWKTAGVQPAYKNRGEIDCENNFRYVGHGPYWKKTKMVQSLVTIRYLEVHNFISIDWSAYLERHST